MKMNGSLIDTNIVIKLMHGDTGVIETFEKLDSIYISTITVGEMFYGAFKSSRVKENLQIFSEFFEDYPVLEISYNTAEIYGRIKTQLVKKGINIAENDLWISSVAIQNNLSLFTMDAHFSNIEGLDLVSF